MRSIMPERYVEIGLMNTEEGKIYYTVPWAMSINADGEIGIDVQFEAHEKPGGTVHLAFVRNADFFLVDERTIKDHKFHIGGDVSHLNPVRLTEIPGAYLGNTYRNLPGYLEGFDDD